MTEQKTPAKRAPRKAAAPQPDPKVTGAAFVDVGTMGRSVHELWSDVMRSVRAIEKTDYNEDQGFKFRGIDAVVDAIGPALRDAGVLVVPHKVKEHNAEYYETRRGTRMVNRTVKVKWRVYGPQGDWFPGESMGEAADAGDKSMSKAQSVAYRTFLLQALAVATGLPDPDSQSHERATGREGPSGAVQSAPERTYASRDDARQAQAGEENQTQAPDAAEARAEMWREAKKLGWEWGKLAARFKSDYGIESAQADKATLDAFTLLLKAEAEEEEERAKANAAEVLGANEVQPDEAQSGGVL